MVQMKTITVRGENHWKYWSIVALTFKQCSHPQQFAALARWWHGQSANAQPALGSYKEESVHWAIPAEVLQKPITCTEDLFHVFIDCRCLQTYVNYLLCMFSSSCFQFMPLTTNHLHLVLTLNRRQLLIPPPAVSIYQCSQMNQLDAVI